MCGGGDAVKGMIISEEISFIKTWSPVRPYRMCAMVEWTGLGSLCLSERGGVPRKCVGAVMW